MARSRTKMIAMAQDVAAPESEVGKVDIRPNNKPRKRDPKERPIEKPSVTAIDGDGGRGAIENLNLASTGELIQRLEKELKVNGPWTEAARRLKAALGKAYDAEPSGLKSKEELELIMRAAASRWPIMPDTKRKVVRVTEKALTHTDPNVRMRAVRNMTALERMNQIDEEKLREENPPYDPPAEPIREISQAELSEIEQRRLRLSSITQRLGFNGVVIDVAGDQPGGNSSETDEPSISTGASNGHASGLCNGHQPGEVENGKAPGHSKPGTNGHSNGSH